VNFDAANFRPEHFLWEFKEGVAIVTLNRPERKNPLTFESYAVLRDTFRALTDAKDVKVVVIRGEGGNSLRCSSNGRARCALVRLRLVLYPVNAARCLVVSLQHDRIGVQ